MKIKEFSESVAKTCDLTPRSVYKAQIETFKQLRQAVERGERVGIPGFGIFFLKEVAAKDGKPAEKIIRLRVLDAAADEAGEAKGEGKEGRAARAEKRAARRKNAESATESAE